LKYDIELYAIGRALRRIGATWRIGKTLTRYSLERAETAFEIAQVSQPIW